MVTPNSCPPSTPEAARRAPPRATPTSSGRGTSPPAAPSSRCTTAPPPGGFVYWTSSPYFAASTPTTQAVWTTPALPAGATGISFGLNIFANGTLTTDDYSYVDLTHRCRAPWSAVARSDHGHPDQPGRDRTSRRRAPRPCRSPGRAASPPPASSAVVVNVTAVSPTARRVHHGVAIGHHPAGDVEPELPGRAEHPEPGRRPGRRRRKDPAVQRIHRHRPTRGRRHRIHPRRNPDRSPAPSHRSRPPGSWTPGPTWVSPARSRPRHRVPAGHRQGRRPNHRGLRSRRQRHRGHPGDTRLHHRLAIGNHPAA